MTDRPLDDTQPAPEQPEAGAPEETPSSSRFPELEELQNDVSRRIRDNQKFLERFMDDDFTDDDPETADEDDAPGDDFEEL